jgi:CDP-diacylglycerol--glycerol-3-phosphate 3-phosphatidyltransferase/cardiolipin synthase
MWYKSYIPNALTYFRFIAAVRFFYTFLNDLFLISLLIIVLAGITDFLDGYIARKIGSTSNKGAYLDVTSDFVFIITCFLAFVIKGWYNPLILILIIIMFFLFIGTSGLRKPVYDPVGKYLGAYLMVMIFISILFQEQLIREFLLVLLILIWIVSVISRLYSIFIQKF